MAFPMTPHPGNLFDKGGALARSWRPPRRRATGSAAWLAGWSGGGGGMTMAEWSDSRTSITLLEALRAPPRTPRRGSGSSGDTAR